jgi:hypothetical protein
LITALEYSSDKPWITSIIKETIKIRQQAWVKNDSHQYKVYHNKVINLCKLKARQRFYDDKISHTHNTNLTKWANQNVVWIVKLTPYNKHSSKRHNIERCLSAKSINESFSRVGDGLP